MACGVGFSGRPGLFSPYALKIQEQLLCEPSRVCTCVCLVPLAGCTVDLNRCLSSDMNTTSYLTIVVVNNWNIMDCEG